jgi:O-antigen/teichoic acid export membrane protein
VHRALKRAASSGIFNNVARPVFLLGAVFGLAWALGERLTAPAALLANCAAALASLLLSAWLLTRAWPAAARHVQPRYEVRAWTILGGQLLLLSLIAIGRSRLDVLVLGGMGSPHDVGPYYAAVQVSGMALYGLNAVNTVLAPMIAERFSARDLPGLQAVARKAAHWAFAMSVLASVAFAVVGKSVLGLFGDEFVRAYDSMLVMLAGYCISASFGEVGFILSMTQYQKQAAYIMGSGVAISLVISVVLVPGLGMLGAAIATAVSIVAWRALALVFVVRQLRLNPTIFGRAA